MKYNMPVDTHRALIRLQMIFFNFQAQRPQPVAESSNGTSR